MTCEYTTNYDDFKAAQRLYVRRGTKARITFLVLQRIIPVLTVVSLALLVWDTGFGRWRLSPPLGGVLAALIWLGVWCPFARWRSIRAAYRVMKAGRADDDPLVLELTETELISRRPNYSEGRFYRSALGETLEDEAVLLLFVGQKNFLLFPKRSVPVAVLAALRDWLRRPAKEGHDAH